MCNERFSAREGVCKNVLMCKKRFGASKRHMQKALSQYKALWCVQKAYANKRSHV